MKSIVEKKELNGDRISSKQTITGECDVKNVTMAKAVTNDGSGDYEKIGWDEKKLSFVVREPFPSNTTDATVVFGAIGEGDPFRVLSKMPENGIIFSDGMEEDAIEFNSGVEVNIRMSEWKGCLVR